MMSTVVCNMQDNVYFAVSPTKQTGRSKLFFSPPTGIIFTSSTDPPSNKRFFFMKHFQQKLE